MKQKLRSELTAKMTQLTWRLSIEVLEAMLDIHRREPRFELLDSFS